MAVFNLYPVLLSSFYLLTFFCLTLTLDVDLPLPGDYLERCEQQGKKYVLPSGLKALIVTTSHDRLGPSNCSTCEPTGVFSAEMTVPYYIFKDAGLQVDISTITGNKVPVDPKEKIFCSSDLRFYKDQKALSLIDHPLAVDKVKFSDYDIVWLAGGWGAAWDLATSEVLARGISSRYMEKKLIGSVCHGGLGLVNALNKKTGKSIVYGRNVTAVTNRQIKQLGIAKLTPFHPETELRKAGANFKCKHGFVTDITASYTAVDAHLVTGQNQNSGCETAQRLLDILSIETKRKQLTESDYSLM